MRRFALAALPVLSILALPVAAASYEDMENYLPPPGPASYSQALQQVAQLPAFKDQSLREDNYAVQAAKTEPAPMPVVRPAINYQIPGIPNYLPMNRVDAQTASSYNTQNAAYGYANVQNALNDYGYAGQQAYVQQAGFIQQGGSGSAKAQQQPSLAMEPTQGYGAVSNQPAPVMPPPAYADAGQPYQPQQPQAYMPPAPVPVVPAPAYVVAPDAYAAAPAMVPAPAPMVMDPAMMPAPAPTQAWVQPEAQMAPQTYSAPYNQAPAPQQYAAPVDQGYAPISTVTQPYNPPTMNGNPTYEYIDAPRPPSMAYDPASVRRGPYSILRSGMTFADKTSFSTATALVENDYHTGWSLSGGLGYTFRPWSPFVAPRVEAEFGTIRQSVVDHTANGTKFTDPAAYGSTDTLTGMVNAYLDFMPYSKTFVPYIGGGVGAGYVDFDRHGVTTPLTSATAIGFSWQAAGGVGINVGKGSMLDIGYRYWQAPDLEFRSLDGTLSKTDVGTHMITFGFRQSF